MNRTLVVTVTGADKPGLVGLLSQTALAHGANWEASRMARMAARFAGILVLSVAPEKAEGLEQALHGLESQGLRVVVEGGSAPAEADGWARLTLDLVGHDRPGILNEISQALAGQGVNVEELETEVASAPMAGHELFKLQAQLLAPPAVSMESLQGLLEGLASDLMVEVTLAPHSPD